MKYCTERFVDSRTKIELNKGPIFNCYIMYIKIPYKSWWGKRKYHWQEVAEVLAERVIDDIDENRENFDNATCGDLLLEQLRTKANKNMKDRRLVVKERNLLNPKLW